MRRDFFLRLSTFAVLAAVLLAVPLLAAAAPSEASAEVTIGDQLNEPTLVKPRTVSLWVSDAIVSLRWKNWGSARAMATGRVSFHNGGKYRYYKTRVVVSRIRQCGGRRIYSRLTYTKKGKRYRAKLSGCRLVGGVRISGSGLDLRQHAGSRLPATQALNAEARASRAKTRTCRDVAIIPNSGFLIGDIRVKRISCATARFILKRFREISLTDRGFRVRKLGNSREFCGGDRNQAVRGSEVIAFTISAC